MNETKKNPYEVEITPENWKDCAKTPLIRIVVLGVVAYLWWVCITA